MKYARQVQGALDNMDVSLNKLYQLVKRGKQSEALKFMEDGDLKEKFEELQSIIKLSTINSLGASGTTSTGTF
tara:strand:- start:160 stop:378 length:219 start_codon:yes stop_codon:yes gene_type:complete